MYKRLPIIGLLVISGVVCSLGCEEWLVGAPCKPETDNGEFQSDLVGVRFAIESRSPQCDTGMCVTATRRLDWVNEKTGDDIEDFEKYEGTQVKYSFCSCRCRDGDGNKYDRNSDKYDDLCECPPNTMCLNILNKNIEGAPEKKKGSYCIPSCIADPCRENNEVCTPSSDDTEPWNWKCK